MIGREQGKEYYIGIIFPYSSLITSQSRVQLGGVPLRKILYRAGGGLVHSALQSNAMPQAHTVKVSWCSSDLTKGFLNMQQAGNFPNRGPQYRAQCTTMLIMGIPRKVPQMLGCGKSLGRGTAQAGGCQLVCYSQQTLLP